MVMVKLQRRNCRGC